MHSTGNQHAECGELGEKKKAFTISCLLSVLVWLVGICYEPHKMQNHKT